MAVGLFASPAFLRPRNVRERGSEFFFCKILFRVSGGSSHTPLFLLSLTLFPRSAVVAGAADFKILFLALSPPTTMPPSWLSSFAPAAAGFVLGVLALTAHSHAQRRRPRRRRRVFVSGCFDLLHSGHVAFFEEARSTRTVIRNTSCRGRSQLSVL